MAKKLSSLEQGISENKSSCTMVVKADFHCGLGFPLHECAVTKHELCYQDVQVSAVFQLTIWSTVARILEDPNNPSTKQLSG